MAPETQEEDTLTFSQYTSMFNVEPLLGPQCWSGSRLLHLRFSLFKDPCMVISQTVTL